MPRCHSRLRVAVIGVVATAGCRFWIGDDDACAPEVDRVRWYADVDEDGFGDPDSVAICEQASGLVDNADDCDDSDADITSLADMGEVAGVTLWYRDADNDGVGVEGDTRLSCTAPDGYSAPIPGDCLDSDPAFSVVCPWTDVAVGETWSCGLRSDGSVTCWGETYYTGEPSEGATEPVDGATALSGSWWQVCASYDAEDVACARTPWDLHHPGLTGIEASYPGVCAWDAEGSFTCLAGVGGEGWLVEDAPRAAVERISLAYDFGCALLKDSSLACWGVNHGIDISPPEGTGWLAVQTSLYSACAAHEDGGVLCWGEDPLGNDFADVPTTGRFVSLHGGANQICGLDEAGALSCWSGDETYGDAPEVAEGFRMVDSSGGHSCAVTRGGELLCWGTDEHAESTVPSYEQHGIALGGGRSCVLHDDGAIRCWGERLDEEPQHAHASLAVGFGWAGSISTVGELVLWGENGVLPPRELNGRRWSQLSVYSSTWADLLGALCAIDEDGALHCWTDDFNSTYYEDLPTDEGFTQVAPSSRHGCALDGQGAIVCWSNSSMAERIEGAPEGGGYVSIAAGEFHNCAVHADGDLVCWGLDDKGGLSGAPTDADFTAVVAHDDVSCALHEDGRASCWGLDDEGMESEAVAEVPDDDDFTALSVAYGDACGLHADGTVSCWGALTYIDQAGVAELHDVATISLGFIVLCAITEDGALSCTPTPEGATWQPFGDEPLQATDLAVGGEHLCAVRLGRPQCWGEDSAGQSTAPAIEAEQVVAGDRHSCALSPDGSVSCWGDDRAGQASPPAGSFSALSAGYAHSCGVRLGGQVQCWGDVASPRLSHATAVSSGRAHACALVGPPGSGSVSCWGDDSQGQASPPSGTFQALALGEYHGCALDLEGKVSCWGLDSYHQVSDAPPVAFTEISAGAEHSCGIKLDGFTTCWGRDLEGQASPPDPTAL